MKIDIIDQNDREIIATWAERLQESRFWGRDVLDELHAAEFRIGAFVAGCCHPIAYASITPTGSPDQRGIGELWFDHLFITEEARGKNIMRLLYEKQLEYVTGIPRRRIFRVPVSSQVVEFSKKRGWHYDRDAPNMPYGVYELPRARLAQHAL